MSNIVIPQTAARLQPYIKLFSMLSSGANVGVPGAAPTFSAATAIGEIQSVDIKITRETAIWRELNTDTGGLPIEVYPTLPTYELTIDRIMLYNRTNSQDSFLGAFGFGPGYDIINQTNPVAIQIELSAPTTNSTQLPVSSNGSSNIVYLTFYGVWFDDVPLKFDINATDLTIKQTVKGKAAGVSIN